MSIRYLAIIVYIDSTLLNFIPFNLYVLKWIYTYAICTELLKQLGSTFQCKSMLITFKNKIANKNRKKAVKKM